MADKRVLYSCSKCITVAKGRGGMYLSLQEMEKEKPVYRLTALQLQSERLIIIMLYNIILEIIFYKSKTII